METRAIARLATHVFVFGHTSTTARGLCFQQDRGGYAHEHMSMRQLISRDARAEKHWPKECPRSRRDAGVSCILPGFPAASEILQSSQDPQPSTGMNAGLRVLKSMHNGVPHDVLCYAILYCTVLYCTIVYKTM